MKINHPDSISSIIKSINPYHYAYSKQNKKLNNYFFSLNLNVVNFIKTLEKINNTKTKFYHQLKYNKNNDDEIQKTFNRLEKLNYNRYLPSNLLNQIRMNNNEESIRKNKKYEIRKKNRIWSKLDDKFYYDITLDPGRYDPKYNLVYKRIKDVYFDRPNTSTKKIYLENSNENKEIKTKNKYKKLIIKNKNNKELKENNIFDNINRLSPVNNFSINKLNTKYKLKKKYNRNFSNTHINFNILSRTTSPKIKPNKTAFLNNTKNKGNRKIFSADIKKTNTDLDNKNGEDKEPEINRCSSCIGIHKGIVSFDKMTGRKNNVFNVLNLKEEIKNEYTPKYEITRPHIYIKKFNTRKSLKGFKKYVVGKIIRNYHFSPIDYFMFDVNAKNENDINDNENFRLYINQKYRI